jgi:GTP-binding protein
LTSTLTNKPFPRVAIVGRPNVGKSTLFNRFLGIRRAITDPTPGVTRDPVETVCRIGGRSVFLVDTGGFRLEGEGIDQLVTKKSLSMIEDADLVLLLLDVTETTPEDESFIGHLRKYADKVLVVVNKVDNPSREQSVWNYHSLGFDHVVGISATHGNNFDILSDMVLRLLDFEAYSGEEPEARHDIALAILGKPNTGKSTLVNLLTGRETSIVSDVPGTTRDVIEGSFEWNGRRFRILDTAGIRRKSRVGDNIEYYSVNRAIRAIDEADVVLLMIDAEDGLSEQDKKIASLIVDRGKGVVLVLNKWDLGENTRNRFEAVSDRVRFLFPVLGFAPLVAISALENQGIDRLLKAVVMVNAELGRRIDTGKLNRAFRAWTAEYAPPTIGRKRYKIRYMTQVSVRPVRFVLFVNRLQGFPAEYTQYIKNKIRKTLGFSHIPINLDLRETEKGDAPFLDS